MARALSSSSRQWRVSCRPQASRAAGLPQSRRPRRWRATSDPSGLRAPWSRHCLLGRRSSPRLRDRRGFGLPKTAAAAPRAAPRRMPRTALPELLAAGAGSARMGAGRSSAPSRRTLFRSRQNRRRRPRGRGGARQGQGTGATASQPARPMPLRRSARQWAVLALHRQGAGVRAARAWTCRPPAVHRPPALLCLLAAGRNSNRQRLIGRPPRPSTNSR
mmetsp:Transcript_132577/g.383218  ORF Transcript_132577/g.383218 Transcript_132577/m.383218 type:complete len:218 (-) Transcript_132577:763-1416(-)